MTSLSKYCNNMPNSCKEVGNKLWGTSQDTLDYVSSNISLI